MNKKQIPLLLIQFLEEESNENHRLSTPYLQSRLAEEGVDASRHTVTTALKDISNLYHPIHFSKENNEQGYWIEHTFTPAETVFLRDAVQASSALSKKKSYALTNKIDGLLSEGEQEQLPEIIPADYKTNNEDVLKMLGQLLFAIQNSRLVYFRYFDWSIKKERTYRKKETYQMTPYAIVSDDGKYYCVMWNKKYQKFNNYRIDKMDHLQVSEESEDTVPFNLKDYLRSSFQMYSGQGQTITISFDLSIANQVFDQFGTDITIIRSDEKTFTAAVHSAITPTLTSWILMFHDHLHVESPNELIQELKKIAKDINKTYK